MPGAMQAEPVLISAGQEDKPEHLQWLCTKDQRVLCRGQCQAALKEEEKLKREIQSTIDAYKSAIGHCRAASESDPGWFTLDVQDSHARRIAILSDALSVLENDPMPVPEAADALDSIRGKIYSGYAHTAQTLVGQLQEQEGVQRLAERGQAAFAGARSSFSSFSSRIRRSFDASSAQGLGTAGYPSSETSSASPAAS
mmetsp:Transcript_157670/g.278291  ORF Transcript_157670/g.278291 Transcript_157670/m.278291 type:complete len:198 (+) Transcript_157670:94-687(+)